MNSGTKGRLKNNTAAQTYAGASWGQQSGCDLAFLPNPIPLRFCVEVYTQTIKQKVFGNVSMKNLKKERKINYVRDRNSTQHGRLDSKDLFRG